MAAPISQGRIPEKKHPPSFTAKIESTLWNGKRLVLDDDTSRISIKIYRVRGPLLELLGKAKKVTLKHNETIYVNIESLDKALKKPQSTKINNFFQTFIQGSKKSFIKNENIKTLFHSIPIKFVAGDRSKFNSAADALKKEDNWKKTLKGEIKKIPPQQLKELVMQTKSLELRGYDREVLCELFKAAKEVIPNNSKNRKVHTKLNTLIKESDVKVLAWEGQEGKEKKVLGGGAVNQVYALKEPDENGEMAIKYVFKPDPSDLDATTLFKEKHFGTAAAVGIPAGSEAHLGSRAVASSVVDELLYGDKNRISVKTEFGVVDGQRGVLMEKATGSSPKTKPMRKTRIRLKRHPEIINYCNGQININGKLSKKDLKYIANKLKYNKVEIVVTVDETGKRVGYLVGLKRELEHLKPDNVETLDGLLRLQIKDIITGECDRHPENYFIAPDGSIKGIDEDCCFGVKAIPEGVDVRNQKARKGIIPNNASLMLRMPPLISEDTRDAVDQLYKNRKNMCKQLEPYITPKEIKATMTRLEKLHKHIHNPQKCRVVPKDKLLDKENTALLDRDNSYWCREMLAYDSDKKGWNYLRKREDKDKKNGTISGLTG